MGAYTLRVNDWSIEMLNTMLSDDFYEETFADSILTADDGSYELRLPVGISSP